MTVGNELTVKPGALKGIRGVVAEGAVAWRLSQTGRVVWYGGTTKGLDLVDGCERRVDVKALTATSHAERSAGAGRWKIFRANGLRFDPELVDVIALVLLPDVDFQVSNGRFAVQVDLSQAMVAEIPVAKMNTILDDGSTPSRVVWIPDAWLPAAMVEADSV